MCVTMYNYDIVLYNLSCNPVVYGINYIAYIHSNRYKSLVASGELHVRSIPAVHLAPMSRHLFATSAVCK